MVDKEVLSLMYFTLMHCEGIPEVTDILGIDPIKVQEKMERDIFCGNDIDELEENAIKAIKHLNEELKECSE